jgi:Na+/H+-dicarboxylate symporter
MFQNLYPHLLAFHGLLRWVVLATAIAAIFVAISGWRSGRPVTVMLLRSSIAFVATMDLAFLLGLLLYFGASPLTKMAFQDMAAAMKDHELRFFSVEHTTYMFLAVILAHIGGALARKGKTDLARHRGAAICFSLSLLLILAGIPWWRPLLRLGS